jgi:hypothetical protein
MSRLGRIARVVLGIVAAAPVAAAAAPPPALATLAAPRAGTALVAGETATLEWAPGPALAGVRHVEEWEAFLSLDGGEHYTIRITPHLDRDLRRVRFRVPDLPTGDARILLRFGDERRELAADLPQRFSIVRAPGTRLDLAAPPAQSFRPGEPARPGERGVRRWIEGSRRGSGMREVESAPSPGADGVAEPPAARRSVDAVPPEPAPDALPTPGIAASPSGPPPGAALQAAPPAAPLAADILLLTRRRNE